MSVTWTDDLATGVSKIDDQHKELFKRINNLLIACNKGKGRREIEGVVKFLDEYVDTHFSDEERIMIRYEYPSYPAHKAQHLEFVEKLSELKKRLDQEGAGLVIVIATNQMLVDWLRTHIRRLDKELGSFLKEKGLSV